MSDWSKLKVNELKEELEKRGLPTSGKKAELVERLEEHDTGAGGSPAKDSQAKDSQAKETDAAIPAANTRDAAGDDDADDHASPRELREEEDTLDVAEDQGGNNKRQRTTEDGQAKKKKKLCRTLFVTGFKVPADEDEVRNLMEKHGRVAKIWMPTAKDVAMVFYERSDGATAARQVLDNFEWPEGSGSLLKSSYRNVHAAVRHVRSGGDPEFTVEPTDEDPVDEKKGDKKGEKKGDKERKERAPNPFRKTTVEPEIYWKTCRAYP